MTRRARAWLRGSSRGQAMAEFTLMVPMLLVIVFAAVEFGRAYSVWVTITNAAREGARYGVINPTDTSGITTKVQNASSPYNDSNLTVSTPTCSPSPCSSGGSLSVTATYKLTLITPLNGLLTLMHSAGIGNNFTLS